MNGMFRVGMLALVCGVLPASAWAFSFDDLEKIEKEEQGDLLQQAKTAATNWEFGSARSLIQQARNKGANAKKVAEAEAVYRKHYAAYEEKQRQAEEAKRLAEEARKEAERQAVAQARQDASGNKGGSLNCMYVSKDYALWQYCERGSCDGFSSNYNLYQLCQYNDADALSSNYAIWNYLKNGNPSGFASNYRAWDRAKQQAGSFADRKRFVIYYLRGFTYGSW